jgi:hypothetical protein
MLQKNISQKQLLSKNECDELIDLFYERYSSTFRLDWEKERGDLHTDRKQRLYLFEKSDILYKTLSDKILGNQDGYLIEIFIAQYNVGEGVDWHTDYPYYEKQPPLHNKRRINFSILLTDDYKGGILEVDNERVSTPVGVITFFDVTSNHRVTRVTNGTRYSLIGWIYK